MKSYGIILIVTLTTITANVVYAQGQQTAEDHVAAVISMRGQYVASVDFSLPKGTTRETAEDVWNRIKEATGWRFGDPRATEDEGVSIQAKVLGGQQIDLSGMSPAWPFVEALSDYSTVALIFLTGASAPVKGSGDFTNRYVTAEWSQSQGVRYYHVTIKDSSFESRQQLRSRADQKPAENTPAPGPYRSWIVVGILAVVIGAIAYGVARVVMSKRERR